jgi:hypothetical protein
VRYHVAELYSRFVMVSLSNHPIKS